MATAILALGGCAVDQSEDEPGPSVTSEDELGLSVTNLALPTCSSYGYGGCHRPTVNVTSAFQAWEDGDGNPGPWVTAAVWSVSSCTPELCTIYRSGGTIMLVGRVALLQHTAATHAGLTNGQAVNARNAWSIRAGQPLPYAAAFERVLTVSIPDGNQAGAVAPMDSDGIGSNNSVSRRGRGIMWSVETPPTTPNTGTGYVGFPAGPGVVVVASGMIKQTTWVNAQGNSAATATWRAIWIHVGNYWVWQWMLERVDPYAGGTYFAMTF